MVSQEFNLRTLVQGYEALCLCLVGAGVIASSSAPPQLDQTACIRILTYLKLLHDWNPRVDLTAPGSIEELYANHALESIAAFLISREYFKPPAGKLCLDMGSGAGLPGVIYSILLPEQEVILCEPREKRALFLKEVRRVLNLDTLTVARIRLEEFVCPPEKEIGLVMARGLKFDLPMMERVESLLSNNGVFVVLGGEEWQQTVDKKAIKTLKLERVVKYNSCQDGPERRVSFWRRFT